MDPELEQRGWGLLMVLSLLGIKFGYQLARRLLGKKRVDE